MNHMNKTLKGLLALAVALALLMPAALAAELTDGIYEAAAPGMNGDITVRVAAMDGEIIKITADHAESDEVGGPAIDALIERAMEAQGPEVDAVAGATETSEAFIAALKAALTQAGWEEPLPEIEMIVRRTPEPVGKVSAPEISFNDVQAVQGDVKQVSGDVVVMNWHAEGEVQRYYVKVEDADGVRIKEYDTTEKQGFVESRMLSTGETYTLTVTAVPKNGTLEVDGVSASVQFALFVAPEPTPEPTPEPVLQTGEISDSWEQIVAAIDDGSARQRYAVGATKALDLEGIGVIHMQLAGFDLDTRSDGQGKAATTWIAAELLPEGHVMNENGTAEGGWRDSDMRAYLQNEVLPAIPTIVRKKIVCVEKHQLLGYGELQVTSDEIWIPANHEMFGGEDGLYYELYQNSDEKRVKTRNGSAAEWWLRSAESINTFYNVSTHGDSFFLYIPYVSYGVALGFCL